MNIIIVVVIIIISNNIIIDYVFIKFGLIFKYKHPNNTDKIIENKKLY